ncbi:hypothetical protein IMCC1989_2585 [gamma proteobacterium IMCC1989]|nr:hypothetical protein IMCC1989_2585 [gamma proteobacterium IMCC1989]
MITPYDKLKSLKDAEQYLKKEQTFEKLDTLAHQISDMKLRGSYKLPELNFLTPSLDEANRLDKQ